MTGPLAQAEAHRQAFLKEVSALLGKYTIYHYKNTCSMGGSGTTTPRLLEYLVGDKQKVNCPWCVRYLQDASRRRKKSVKSKARKNAPA